MVPKGVLLAAVILSIPVVPVLGQTAGPFDKLVFRNIGPTGPSGRVNDLAVLARDPNVFYIATATGGLWKTTNGGVSLAPVFDSAGSASVGAVALPPADANLVWVGTGEANNRQSSSWGDGVYKSTNGGRSWTNMGLRGSKQIAKIVIDPLDHDIVYVAALGDLWAPGGDRGVFKTTDGGLTWSKVLDVGLDAGATELVMDPANSKVLYAASYQRRRASFGMNGGGPHSALWKTTDGGRTWQRLAGGIPEGPLGRVGLDIHRRNPDVIYARIEHEKQGGVYRSDDAGVTWKKQSSRNGRPMYFGVIKVDPSDDLRVYMLETDLAVSDDGGKTFRSDGASRIHVDHHALWINPDDSRHLIIGNDGGVSISRDRSRTWMWLPNLPVAQFYRVGFDMQVPFNVCGGLQDNQSWCAPSQVRNAEGVTASDWWTIPGGDGFGNLIDPTNARLIYTSSQEGYFSRFDKVTGETKGIRPEPSGSETPYRWNWDTPFLISPHDPAVVYIGGNRLFRSTDRGLSWRPISGDLTTAVDRDTFALMGTRLKDVKLARNDGVQDYGTLFTVAESRLRAGLIYTGSDDGQIHVTRDGGTTWSNVTARVPRAPAWAYVSRVEPSKFAEGTVYATFDAHRTGDYGTYVYASTDYGASWKSAVGNLPPGEVARSITEDLKNPDVLYLGTETGLFATLDRGRTWTRVRANLPTVPVYEITLHPRDNAMILATHGRGIWILDDLVPFQQATRAQTAGAMFEATPVAQRNTGNLSYSFFQGDMQFIGPNPAPGARISYWLGAKADSVRLVIDDALGNRVRELKDAATKEAGAAGYNSVVWDLRIEPIPAPKGPSGGSSAVEQFFGGGGGATQGPSVLPGRFNAMLFVDGRQVGSTSVVVQGDPDIQITDADRQRRYDLLKEGQQLQARLAEAATAVRTVNQQLGQIRSALADTTRTPAPIRAALDSLTNDLAPLKVRFFVRDPDDTDFDFALFRKVITFKLSGMLGDVGGATMPPSPSDLVRWEDLKTEVPATIAEVNALVARLKPFYQRLAEAGLYPAVPKPITP